MIEKGSLIMKVTWDRWVTAIVFFLFLPLVLELFFLIVLFPPLYLFFFFLQSNSFKPWNRIGNEEERVGEENVDREMRKSSEGNVTVYSLLSPYLFLFSFSSFLHATLFFIVSSFPSKLLFWGNLSLLESSFSNIEIFLHFDPKKFLPLFQSPSVTFCHITARNKLFFFLPSF